MSESTHKFVREEVEERHHRSTMDRRLGLRPPHFSPFFNHSSRFFDDFEFDRFGLRPYWAEQTLQNSHRIGDGVDLVNNDKEYNVTVDVSQFAPEELKVNIVDNQLIIEGKHSEKEDKYGTVERFFVRKYTLPAGVRPENIKSELSKEGLLTVKYEKQPEEKPKSIPITIVPKPN
ncbi:unnamed protein product [Caenorhabditis bovis]|uniref:SHSP domain-containing protein n=1 Tax=Caenorhabditis bovis TaxID=2654633 RepID=A0A8S1E9M3_9PELO|nr:unnamed protein product [Caenorhabditis bovis]